MPDDITNVDAYINGWNDAQEGNKQKGGQHPDYLRGFDVCFSWGETLTGLAERGYPYGRQRHS